MAESFALKVGNQFQMDQAKTPRQNLMEQYENVIVESVVTSFGLDMLLCHDQYGGDVDTIHNVRNAGSKDSDGEVLGYKNKDNARDYANRGEYKSQSAKYHHTKAYIKKNDEYSRQRKEGNLTDAYTGKKMKRNETHNLDHVISAEEIHNDPGRVLSGLDGKDLATADTNLAPTSESVNKSKQQKSVNEYLDTLDEEKPAREKRIRELRQKGELTDKERKELNCLEKKDAVDAKRMREKDKIARDAYNRKINIAYYTSPKFLKDTAYAAGGVGVEMGKREALGFILLEVWKEIRAELSKVAVGSEAKEFFLAVGRGATEGIQNAIKKYKELLARFKDGFISGVLSSLTTTLFNAIFTTGKRVIRIIRESWAAIVKAVKVLFWNPDHLPLGERLAAVAKILAIAASAVVGNIVAELTAQWTKVIPWLGSKISAFCGAFVTGIMSCTFVYVIDNSEKVKKLVAWINKLDFANSAVNYFKEETERFEHYAAQLMELDWEIFNREIDAFDTISERILAAKDEEALTDTLLEAYREQGMKLPYEGDFDDFMGNSDKHLVFE